MTATAATAPRYPRISNLLHSNTYMIFILVLTIVSLIIMVVQILLPNDSETWALANVYDNVICLIFLVDFAMHMLEKPHTRDYFIGERGYLDLLGSIPNFGLGVFQYAVLFRLFRLSRLFRLRRLTNPENRALLRKEILQNRGQYALLITGLLAGVVLMFASVFVLFFESKSPDANITNGGDALWWAIVTITTVGYGDKFPVTPGGRSIAVLVMFSGVGIIGALASILASILVPQPAATEDDDAPARPAVDSEIAALRRELAAMRELLEKERTHV